MIDRWGQAPWCPVVSVTQGTILFLSPATILKYSLHIHRNEGQEEEI